MDNIHEYETFNEGMKFTFKTTKPTGRYRSFGKDYHEIKVKGIVCGAITHLESDAWNKYPEDQEGKYAIRLMVDKEPTKEQPAPFKWSTIKQKFDSLEDAKKFITDNAAKIESSFKIHLRK